MNWSRLLLLVLLIAPLALLGWGLQSLYESQSSDFVQGALFGMALITVFWLIAGYCQWKFSAQPEE